MNPGQETLDWIHAQYPATVGNLELVSRIMKVGDPWTPVPLTAEDRPHHPYSPSTLQNREWCPCYEGDKQRKVHQRATAGTRAHGVVETGEDDARISDEDAVAAAECMDFVEQRRRIMDAESKEAQAAAEDEARRTETDPPLADEYHVLELKEVYLGVDDKVFEDCEATTAGYVDRVLLNCDGTYAEMFDWKFGMWPVEDADENLQGISYTLGLFRKFPTLKKVRFFFKQPLLGVTSDHIFSREDDPALYLRVQTVVARAREAKKAKAVNDWTMANPAVPVCNFCSELGRCTKVAALAVKVGQKFHPISVPEDITPSMVQDPAQTSLGLRLASVLKIWCDAFRKQVTDRVIRGDAPLPEGQRIQEMSKREIVDQDKLHQAALRYLTEQEWQTTLDTSFGAIEDLISERAPRGQKEATVKEFRQSLLDCGAVKMGDKFSFLRAIAEKKQKQ